MKLALILIAWGAMWGFEPAATFSHKLHLGLKLECITCHTGTVEGRAPNLEGIYKKLVVLTNGETVRADDNYLRESILQPAAKVVAGYRPIMPTYQGQITEEELVRVTRELEEVNQELQRLSSLDGLTGIANRRHFDNLFQRAWRQALRQVPANRIVVAPDCLQLPDQVGTFRWQRKRDPDHCALMMRIWRMFFSPALGAAADEGRVAPNFFIESRKSFNRAVGTSAKSKTPC